MMRAKLFFAGVATVLAASAASAAEHEILILEDAYFPSVVYLDEGDTVTFTNLTGVDHNIVSANDGWELGPIANEASVSMVFDENVQTTFFDKDKVSEEDGSFLVEGSVSFSAAPLD